MPPLVYFTSRMVDGVTTAFLMTLNGQLISVDPDNVMGKFPLGGLPRNTTIEPTDIYSQSVLLSGLKQDPDRQFYIIVNHNPADAANDDPIEVIKEYFKQRHGTFRRVPHHTKLRECDILRGFQKRYGFDTDKEFSKRASLTYSPLEKGVIKVAFNYTSLSGKEYSMTSEYPADTKAPIFSMKDRVSVACDGINAGESQGPMYLGEIIRGFKTLAELGVTVINTAPNTAILQWGWMDKPRFREAAFNIFGTLSAQKFDLDKLKFHLNVTIKSPTGLTTASGYGKFYLEGDIINCVFEYEV